MQRKSQPDLISALSDPRWRTSVILNIAAVVEKADEQVLPAVYYFIGRSLGATPSQLGQLVLCRALVQALTSPLSGLIGDKADRTKVVAFGCALWGVCTSVVGLSRTIPQAMLACGFNGLGLALVIPCLQSLVADLHPADRRGRAFGIMFCTGHIGGMLGGFFATNVGSVFLLGLDGWRIAFHSMALLAFVTTYLVLKWAVDPRPRALITPLQLGDDRHKGATGYARLSSDEDPSGKDLESRAGRTQRTSSGSLRGPLTVARRDMWTEVLESLHDIRFVFRIQTFRVILLQGIIGSLPWQAMVFFTLWFQLLGFSDLSAATLAAMFALGASGGHILGGWIGDSLMQRYPDSGRIVTAQFSIFAGVPLSWLLLRVLPAADDPVRLGWAFGLLLLVMGGLVSWPGGANSAIMADVCPSALRSTIYSFDRSLEGSLAACAAPLVGLIAESYYGFQGAAAGGDPTSEGNEHRRRNANALGSSLLVCLLVPWVFCFLSYTGAHWTYPADRAAANRANKRGSHGSQGDLVALVSTGGVNLRRWPSEGLLAEQTHQPQRLVLPRGAAASADSNMHSSV